MARPEALARFIAVAAAGLDRAFAPGHPGHAVAQRMRGALAVWTAPPDDRGDDAGTRLPNRLPVCAHLPQAFAHARATGTEHLRAWADAFEAVAPNLQWARSQRPGSAAFHDGHSNTEILGPAGLAPSTDVVLGASLLAPGVTYPDHTHPPEEVYLVLSTGDWFNPYAGWYTPGAGGAVHHPPGIVHAMRAGPEPLLAVWCLWTGP